MKRIMMVFLTAALLSGAAVFTVSPAAAQTKDADNPTHEKKYIVRILTVENGDTTVTDQAVEPDGEELSWVDDDGNEITAIVESDDDADMKEDMTVEVLGGKKYREYKLQSGKDGRPMKFIVKKRRGDGHAGTDCCGGGSCCMMGGMKKMEMHGMHGKMDKEEMMRMHEKMGKKMMWKERKEKDDDEDEDDDSATESDDEDGNNLP